MKRTYLLLLLFAILSVQAQTNRSFKDTTRALFVDPDLEAIGDYQYTLPRFPEGDKVLYEYIDKKVREKFRSKKNTIVGRVVVEFTVDIDGSASDFKVKEKLDPKLDEIALEIAKSIPKWIPGERCDEPFKTSMFIFVRFKAINTK